MTNKLSELSKPVAWKFKNADGGDRVSLERKANIYGRHDFQPCYSQEYVSALLAELEAKDERIAELEAIQADASQVFKEIGNELGCNPDNESIMMAIDALKDRERRVVALAGGNAELWETMAARLEAAEAKLATPVQLPNKNDDEFWFDNVFQVAKFDREVERSISAAGFKFVGDEQ